MSDFEKALVLIVISNLVNIIITIVSNRGRKVNNSVERLWTETQVMKRDLELLRKDCEANHKK